MKYYCYVYYDTDWSPYYVGKGSWKRSHSRTDGVVIPDKKFIQVFKFEYEWQAHECEIELIAFWKRKIDGGLLNNISFGGPGCRGFKHSEEHKKRMSELFKGKTLSKETRTKIGNANRNPTTETRKKMSDVKKGKKLTSEHRQKMSESHKGKKHSAKARINMSEAAKKRWAKIS